MLRVWTVSGEELAVLPKEELSDVRALKSHLRQLHGLPRFRQKLLHEGCNLDDGTRSGYWVRGYLSPSCC